MLVSRGQIFAVGLIESAAVIGIGTPLGIAAGSRLARLMGYTQSSMSFVWREPLPVSPLSFNVPMVAIAVVSTLIARLGPIGRSARTSVVEHERVRARPPGKPFWQRFYLDVALLTVEVLSIRADFGAASLGEMMNRLAQQDDGVIVSEKAAALFIPFFQAADGNVLNPPALLPRIAWAGIGQIAAAFTVALVIAQGVVIATALRGGVFQALRLGDREEATGLASRPTADARRGARNPLASKPAWLYNGA